MKKKWPFILVGIILLIGILGSILVLRTPNTNMVEIVQDGEGEKMRQQKESLWIYCPICGGKTRTKVYEDTVLVKFPLYCPKCKREIRIDVIKLKMVLSQEPDA